MCTKFVNDHEHEDFKLTCVQQYFDNLLGNCVGLRRIRILRNYFVSCQVMFRPGLRVPDNMHFGLVLFFCFASGLYLVALWCCVVL